MASGAHRWIGTHYHCDQVGNGCQVEVSKIDDFDDPRWSKVRNLGCGLSVEFSKDHFWEVRVLEIQGMC